MLLIIVALLALNGGSQLDPGTCLGIDCDSAYDPYAPSYQWSPDGYFTQTNPLFELNNSCSFFGDCPGRTPEECREHCDRYMESLHRGCNTLVHWWDRMICRQQANEEYARCLRDC
jgi:hypothetical protein